MQNAFCESDRSKEEKKEHRHVTLRKLHEPPGEILAKREDTRALQEFVVPLIEGAVPTR